MSVYHYEIEDLSLKHSLRNLRCDTIRPLSTVTGAAWGGQVEIRSSLGANQKMIGRMCTLNLKVHCGIANDAMPSVAVPLNTWSAPLDGSAGTAITNADASNLTPPHTVSRNWLLSNFNNITVSVNGVQVTQQQFPGLIKTANDIAFGGFTKDCGSGDAIPIPLLQRVSSTTGAAVGGFQQVPSLDRRNWDFIGACNDTIGDSLESVISCHIPCSVFESQAPLPGCTQLQIYFSINGQYRNLLLDDQSAKTGSVIAFDSLAGAATGTVGVSIIDFWLNRYTVTDDTQSGLDQEMYFFNYFYQPNSITSSNFTYTLSIPPATRKLLFCFVSANRGGTGTMTTAGQSSETDFNTGLSTNANAVESCQSLQVRHDGNSYPAVQYNMAPLINGNSTSLDTQRAYQDFIANSSANCDRLGPSLANKNQWALQKFFVWMLPQGGAVSSSQIEVTYVAATNATIASGQTQLICIAYTMDRLSLKVDQSQELKIVELSRVY